jgi:hypothetical protein
MCLISILLFILVISRTEAQEEIMNFHFHDTSFSEFAENIYRISSVKIFYREADIRNLVINIDHDNITVIDGVNEAMAGSGLNVSSWNGNIVITSGKELLSTLPDYGEAKSFSDSVANIQQVTESEERYLKGRKQNETRTIRIGNRQESQPKSKVKVLGRILDEETGEPLISVPVYFIETKSGAVTDVNGFFTIVLPAGKYNVNIDYLGYAEEHFIMEVLSEGSFTFSIRKAAIQLKDVEIKGELQSNIRVKDPGLDQIPVQSIKTLPMMMGERDILKISGTLPGITTVGEGSTGLNVRGSGSDQNAFYINRIPVYNTSHLFGFFSAFNSDVIRDFSIYKGYIPAEFGGRLSSVFNIITRQGNRKQITARGGISPVAGNIVIEGPIKKDTGSFIFNYRTTYSDWILSRIRDTTISASKADFNDLSGGIYRDFKKTQLSLFYYHSHDRFKLAELNEYIYSNDGGSIILTHSFSSSVRGELSFIASMYKFSTTDRLSVSSAWKHAFNMETYGSHAVIRHITGEKNKADYGFDINLFRLNRGTVLPFDERSLFSDVILGKERGLESAVFITDSYEPLPWLNIDIGVRYSLFIPTGPADVYTYEPGLPVDKRYITDTLRFAKNRPIKWYNEPDLRAALNILTDRNGSVKMAFNRMHQNLFMLNTTIALSPNTQWKLADYHLLPSESNQVSLGIFRSFPKYGLEVSTEAYYKRTLNSPQFREGADFLRNPIVETAVVQGDQNAYGIEFYLKRSRRKLEGWISYTYSRSMIRVTGDQAWEKINKGRRFPSDYDIPNSLNAVLNYYFTRRIIFSSIFAWQSGRPVTYPEAVYYINGAPFLNYSERNAYRIPDYMRLDLSLTVEGNLRANKLIHSSFIFNVYNATGRMNPYSVYFSTENGKIKSYKYTVIGVPIFTATWQFKLGNYASE